jgi:hypothetical protein
MKNQTTTLTPAQLEQQTELTWHTEGPDENGNPYYSSTHGEGYNIWYFHQDNGTDLEGQPLKANMVAWKRYAGYHYAYPETTKEALKIINELLG